MPGALMSFIEQNTKVVMERVSLAAIPEYGLPQGFALRWYQAGDEAVWLQIQAAADPYNDITADLFFKTFGNDQTAHEQRICFLTMATGELIGTAAAWWGEEGARERRGRIHWVAILPAFQGRGLAKPLLTAVCLRLRELEHDSTYLTTSAARIPALNLYRQFGFVPVIRDETERAAWQEIELYLRSRQLGSNVTGDSNATIRPLAS
jgi:ribosomal protein S18 acetylase RimI-like enzyme